jgi:hypothetical protein
MRRRCMVLSAGMGAGHDAVAVNWNGACARPAMTSSYGTY